MSPFEPESTPGLYLEQFRSQIDPSPAQLEAMGDQLARRLAAGDGGPDFESLPDPGSASVGATGSILAGKAWIAAVALAVGGALAIPWGTSSPEAHSTLAATPPVVAPPAPRSAAPAWEPPEPATGPVPAPTISAPTARPETTAPPEPKPRAHHETSPVVTRTPTAARSAKVDAEAEAEATPAADDADAVRDEVALYKRAQAALRGGAPDRALTLIQTLRTRHPKGILAAERELLHAETLCAAGKPKAARARAKRFIASHAGSPLIARARHLCGE